MKQKIHISSSIGFTLIEVLVVIAIVGMLASIVLTYSGGTKDRADIAVVQKFADSMHGALRGDEVGIWTFDEGLTDADGIASGDYSIIDSSGNNHHGTPTDNPKYKCGLGNTPSGNGCSILFITTLDYINLGNVGLSLTDKVTYEFWIKMTSLSPTYKRMLSRSTMSFYQLNNGDTYNRLYFREANILAIVDPSPIELNKWYYIVGTYDRSNIKLYVNGKLLDSRIATANLINPDSNTQIGKYSTSNSYDFPGYIDDVRIYDVAMPAAEIQKHYAEGLKIHQNLASNN